MNHWPREWWGNIVTGKLSLPDPNGPQPNTVFLVEKRDYDALAAENEHLKRQLADEQSGACDDSLVKHLRRKERQALDNMDVAFKENADLRAENERLKIKASTFEALNGIKLKHYGDKCPACRDEIVDLRICKAELLEALGVIATGSSTEKFKVITIEDCPEIAKQALEKWGSK